MTGSFAGSRTRIDAVLARIDLVALIGRVVKLGRGRNPRGKCPFHGSNSDSFAVMAEPRGGGASFAHCWGCGWHGDAIKFVCDHDGVEFREALQRLEMNAGIDARDTPAVRREKRAQPRRGGDRELIDPALLGRWLWDHGKPDFDALRVWFRARRVSEDQLSEVRLAASLRFVELAPIVPWAVDAKPDSVPQAPAMVAIIRRRDESGGIWRPIGVHVTFLAPDLASKMERARRDGSPYPARKMLGETQGGAVLLGRVTAGAPIYVGEGLETVLSGLQLAGAHWKDGGLATLSLDNLAGQPLRTKGGALPLYDIRPDPARPAPVAFAHDGAVVGLIDADMKPLRGVRDRETGEFRGEALIERRGANVVHRAITTAERATICGELFVKNWRAAGCRQVRAARPPMGMDFNDLGRVAA